MVRFLVLNRLHNLLDEKAEFKLLDLLSFQRVYGLATAVNIPNRTTVWNFENRIGAIGALALFDSLNAQSLGQGYQARSGQIIDATLVPAPMQHFSLGERALIGERAMPADWELAKRRQKDTDATRTKKHGRSYFGSKLSVNADRRYELFRKIQTDTARLLDGQHFEAVLDQANTSSDVYSDRGYASQARESDLRASGYRPQIQRRGTSKRKLSKCQQRRNHRTAKVRARVGHVFAAITQMSGKLIRTIGQVRADFGMTMMALCYNIKCLSYLKTAGIEAF
jgi:IS5 family transposase